MGERVLQIAVIGPSRPEPEHVLCAERAGGLIAARGWVLLTGGLGGVMEAASRGASAGGGLVVAVLPSDRIDDANAHARVRVATGMGEARNVVLICSADAVIAIGRGLGTLSEVALTLRSAKPFVAIDSWSEVDRSITTADTPEQAVDIIASQLARREEPTA
ncbi:MAG: TIGR00725 family protein [Planctomycetota bacterium]|nr:MAG: TIGR00725 family protein [Planctomycetota bacterium]